MGSFEPNAFGLHDVFGNVFEWCATGIDDYHKKRGEQGAKFSLDPVCRGGSFLNPAAIARVTFRYGNPSEYSGPDLGARPIRVIDD